MISKPFLILGSLVGVSAAATAGYFGISALDSKTSQQETTSSTTGKGEEVSGGEGINTQTQTSPTQNAEGASGASV